MWAGFSPSWGEQKDWHSPRRVNSVADGLQPWTTTLALSWSSSLPARPADSGLANLQNCVSQVLKTNFSIGLSFIYTLSPIYTHTHIHTHTHTHTHTLSVLILWITLSFVFSKNHFLLFWSSLQPTPLFLPGASHGERSLVGYSPWGCKGSATTEATWHTCTEYLVSIPLNTAHLYYFFPLIFFRVILFLTSHFFWHFSCSHINI